MLLSKSQLKHPQVDSPPPTKRGKKVLYGSASMMLAFMVGSAPYAVAQDDDSDKKIRGTIQFTEGKYEVPEGGAAVLCVERRGGKSGHIMALYGTTSGSAKPGSDYMPKIGHVMWDDGDDSTKPVVIHIKKDPAKEKNESFYVTLLDMPAMPKDGMQAPDGLPKDGSMPKDGMPKDGMPKGDMPEGDMPKDGMPKDGMPPKDGMSKDGMMPDDMAQYWQYCMPEGEMPEDMSKDDMSEDDMMDEMGNPDTVYFGGRFQAEVNILDNKEPPSPPPGQAKPDKPGKPGQSDKPGQPGQSDQADPEGDDDNDDLPSSITPDEGPVASEGAQTEIAINSQTFINLSLKQRFVVKSEGTVVTQRVVTKETIGVSQQVFVVRARITIRGRIRDGNTNGFTEAQVNAFFDMIEADPRFSTLTIDREQAINNTLLGSLGDFLFPTTAGSWASVSVTALDPITIAPAIATSIAAKIANDDPNAELSIDGTSGMVTYTAADGSSTIVSPRGEVTTSNATALTVTVNGNSIVVEANSLSQTFDF